MNAAARLWLEEPATPAGSDDLMADIAVEQMQEMRRLRDSNRVLRTALDEALDFIARKGFAGAARKMRERLK